MNDKLNKYVDGVFAPCEGTKSVSELKQDLLTDLGERFRELKAEGKNDATAFDGARMDKLTYAGLKALGAELSAVTVD